MIGTESLEKFEEQVDRPLGDSVPPEIRALVEDLQVVRGLEVFLPITYPL